jgi:uncharacterized oligopeptide transporter (OPT) family protein
LQLPTAEGRQCATRQPSLAQVGLALDRRVFGQNLRARRRSSPKTRLRRIASLARRSPHDIPKCIDSRRRPAMKIERELSLRAVGTGMLLGALLTPSNVYAGLKIGWSFNMSIIALLAGFGFWRGVAERFPGQAGWTPHESNINQTVASAAASIVSGGLVAPIPAHTLLTGQSLDALPLIAWVFSVSFLGIWIAWYLRPSLVEDDALVFPEGVATLEALTNTFRNGREAAQRLAALFAAALASGIVKWIDDFGRPIPRWSPSALLERLGFSLDPSLLLLGFGIIIGMRVGLSLLAGTLLAWGGIAPWLLAQGLVALPPGASGPQFAALVQWLLWPGVSFMVCATLAALATRLIRQRAVPGTAGANRLGWPAPGPALGLLLSVALVVCLQVALFGIDVLMALLSIPLAVCLAVVAARVVGATGIAPIGAIGKVSQLTFGVIAPGQVTINLMSANTAGGAAGQCTDLMNDFRVGKAIGATPMRQLAAQCVGIAIGSIVGVLSYRALIPDPQTMLLTAEWPAPAVATWKAVAQTLSAGLGSLSVEVHAAIGIGALAGAAVGVMEAALPAARLRWLPNPAAFGLAFILPASVSMMMAVGAILTWLVGLRWREAAQRYGLAIAAGLVAGESMAGVGASVFRLVQRSL